MTTPVRQRTRLGSQGFTLVELLVVVIILGILSAVVVFAVQGVGDKGESNAIATDKRIIRTALEAYCARNGTYPPEPDPMKVLVDEKFLSDASEHHHLDTGTKGPDYPEGLCGGQGYKLGGGGDGTQDPASPAKCIQLKDGVEEEVVPEPEQWCLAAPPTGLPGGDSVHYLAPLRDGRVLSIMDYRDDLALNTVLGTETTRGHNTELFDPAAGDRGEWTVGPPAYTLGWDLDGTGGSFKGLVALTGRPGRDDDDCKPRCGQVLAQFTGKEELSGAPDPGADHWKLYDPAVGSAGAWTEIVPRSSVRHGGGGKGIQLLGPGCEPLCGKVLIVPRSSCDGQENVVELYDPKTNEFTIAGAYPLTWQLNKNCAVHPQLVELPDGRILLTSNTGNNETIAVLLNPRAEIFLGFFQEIARKNQADMKAPGYYIYETRPTDLGPGRGIFFTRVITEIYRPDPAGGPGAWDPHEHCGEPLERCHLVSVLTSGEVLVHVNTFGIMPGMGDPSVRMRLLDPTKSPPDSRWSDTASLNDPGSGGYAVRLSGTGCGQHCGKVLMVGYNNNQAELYTPPS